MKDKGEIINKKILEVERLIELIRDCYRSSQKSVQMAYLYALFLAVQEVKTHALRMKNKLLGDLHDEYDLDYPDMKNKIHTIKATIDDVTNLEGIEGMRSLNMSWKMNFDDVEASEMDFDFDKCGSFDLRNIRGNLWDKQYSLISNISKGLSDIEGFFKEIIAENEQFNVEVALFEEEYRDQGGDIQNWDRYPMIGKLKARFLKTKEEYFSSYWEDAYQEFVEEMEEYFYIKTRQKETYRMFRRKKSKVTSTLASLDLTERCLYVEAYRKRINYELADIHEAICYHQCMHLLDAKIESFDLLKSPDSEYDILFVNRAAQEFMMLLAPVIKKLEVFPHAYSYASLLFAMIDFGITDEAARNTKQMFCFVNNYLRDEDEQISDSTSIGQKRTLLLGHSFGRINRGYYQGTNLSDAMFVALSDAYWACFTLFNEIFQKDVMVCGFANYLDVPHDKIIEVRNILKSDPEKLHRLQILKSVIAGETADF